MCYLLNLCHNILLFPGEKSIFSYLMKNTISSFLSSHMTGLKIEFLPHLQMATKLKISHEYFFTVFCIILLKMSHFYDNEITYLLSQKHHFVF